MASAICGGRAESLGNLGDPVYLAGAFWQMSADHASYELVVEAAQIATCANALRRLRRARAITQGSR